MKLADLEQSGEKLMRIIQETVPGKQVTMAHVIASPNTVIYQKLGLDPKIDYAKAAIGILTMTPSETSIIAADIALKKSSIDIGFIDRFSGTLIITGKISDVMTALEAVLNYAENVMGFTVCDLTKA